LKEEYDLEVEWLPFELHPEIPPDGMELPDHVRSQFGGMSERLGRLAQEAGLNMTIPGRIPNSRKALEASEYAREQHQHDTFHQVVFRKFYGEGMDISDWQVLREAAEEVGLDPDEMQTSTESGQYRSIVDEQINEAQTRGISGVPTYIINDQHVIVGAQSHEVFTQTFENLGFKPKKEVMPL